jgi:hypothetical protein
MAPLPANSLKDTEKLLMALRIAHVYEQTGSPASAVPYLKLAARLESDQGRSTELRRRIDRIKTGLVLEERNVQRRPSIQRGLDQSALVRPRLRAEDLAREVAQ